jgi:hypothetical protein
MMKQSFKYKNLSIFVFFAFLATMVFSGSALADAHGMGTNLSSMSELTSKFSMLLSTGKVDAKTQEKMGEILSRMSEVLQEMAGTGGSAMNMEHSGKIEGMKKEFDPFDTSDRM